MMQPLLKCLASGLSGTVVHYTLRAGQSQAEVFLALHLSGVLSADAELSSVPKTMAIACLHAITFTSETQDLGHFHMLR